MTWTLTVKKMRMKMKIIQDRMNMIVNYLYNQTKI